MKKAFVIFIFVTLVGGSVSADGVGSAFGALTTARTQGQGRIDLGIGAGIADATTVFATLEFGLSQYTDFRGKLGLYDDDFDDVDFAVGADLKWQFWDMAQGRREPFDMSFGAMFEYIKPEYASVIEIGGFVIGSYPFVLENAGTLSPYARFNVRLESVSWDDDFPGHDDSDTDIRFGINGGAAWEASDFITIFGEFQIDGNDGVFLGVNFNLQ